MSDTRIITSNIRKMVIRSNTSGQGSSAVCKRLVINRFSKSGEVTIGADFAIKQLDDIKLNIWDTCAQDRFDSILMHYFRGANIFLFCVSATDLLNDHCDLSQINMKINNIRAETHCPLILVITKCDLLTAQTKLDLKEKIENCIANKKLRGMTSHVFCSALDGSGFDLLQSEIARLLPVKQQEEKLHIIPNKEIKPSIAMRMRTLFSCCNKEPSDLSELKLQHEKSSLKMG